jgi:hypothetical protein
VPSTHCLLLTNYALLLTYRMYINHLRERDFLTNFHDSARSSFHSPFPAPQQCWHPILRWNLLTLPSSSQPSQGFCPFLLALCPFSSLRISFSTNNTLLSPSPSLFFYITPQYILFLIILCQPKVLVGLYPG